MALAFMLALNAQNGELQMMTDPSAERPLDVRTESLERQLLELRSRIASVLLLLRALAAVLLLALAAMGLLLFFPEWVPGGHRSMSGNLPLPFSRDMDINDGKSGLNNELIELRKEQKEYAQQIQKDVLKVRNQLQVVADQSKLSLIELKSLANNVNNLNDANNLNKLTAPRKIAPRNWSGLRS